ncbi:MAG: hypothetical protein ACW972_00185 [Promethearchaeota archaeon]
MICDVLIIKDGLPLLSKSFSNSSNVKNMFSEIDNLIMVSGFFSALNSFSDSFESLGCISEMKMDNSNLKLSILRDPHLPELIFLATFDRDSDLKGVQRFLKKISTLFFEKFDVNQISKWNGKLDSFKSFENVIEECANENESIKEIQENSKEFDWLTSFKTDEIVKVEEKTDVIEEIPEFYEYVPISTTNVAIGSMKNYLTGDTSYNVYDKIDGKKTINQISFLTNLEQIKVYNICKSLVKMGFIDFN